MTLAEILQKIDARYPNAVSISDKIHYLNLAQYDISKFFGRYIEDITSLTTVATQERYDYPTNLGDISDIIMLEISTTATPAEDSDYVEHSLGSMVDKSRSGNVYYDAFQTVGGVRQIGIFPIPDTTGYIFRIRYLKPFAELVQTDLTAEPEFDVRYHDALISYACYKIAASTSFPDETMANIFSSEWESSLDEIYRFYGHQRAASPRKRRDNRWWHGSNSSRAKY